MALPIPVGSGWAGPFTVWVLSPLMKLLADWLKTLVMNGVPGSPGAKNRCPTLNAWPLAVSVVFAWARNVMPGKLVGSVAVADPLKLTGAEWGLVGGLSNASTCWTFTVTWPRAVPAIPPNRAAQPRAARRASAGDLNGVGRPTGT